MDTGLITNQANPGPWRGIPANLVTLAIVVAFVAIPASATAATTCRVRNEDSGARYTRVRAAVRTAAPDDTLLLKGTCHERISIREDLFIEGVRTATSGRPTLDGDGEGIVVKVATGSDVAVSKLTIRGGASSAAGVVNRGGLLLIDVIVSGNAGGGLYNGSAGHLRLDGRTKVHANTADVGGGVFNEGVLTLYGRTRISHNTADQGGGVYSSGNFYLYDSATVRDNWATEGGGVYSSDDIWMRDSATVRDNRAEDGGGVYSTGDLSMEDSSSISDNTATADGGGLGIWDTLRMNDSSSIHDNTADRGGGLIAYSGVLVYVRCGPAADANVRDNAPDDCYLVGLGD